MQAAIHSCQLLVVPDTDTEQSYLRLGQRALPTNVLHTCGG